MKVTVLGSGTGVPSLQHSAPGYLLEAQDQQILVDCGSGVLRQLLQVDRSHTTLDAVCITHTHPDHIGDLIPMIHALRLPGLGRQKPLTLHGPPGFADYFARYVEPVTGLPQAFPLEVREVTDSWEMGGVIIRTTPTIHSASLRSVAYRFEDAGRVVVFSGDLDMDPEFVIFASGADVLVLDCSTLAAGKVEGHLSADECGRVALQARARNLILSHLYPIPGPGAMRLAECREHFKGSIQLARDLMSMTV